MIHECLSNLNNSSITFIRVFFVYVNGFSSISELSVRGESNELHIFNNFILQQIIVSN